MLNSVFVFLVFAAILLAGLTGNMRELSTAILKDGGTAVSLAIGLVGVMAFFLGLMRVAEKGGLLRIVARAVSPVMRLLFPGVPADHPAMSAMILNISSNMLGLGNAATPFGIKAMEELNKLNTKQGTATNAMVLFLAINTAGLAILPTGVIGIRAALGSENAAAIFFPTWFASGCATVVGVLAAFLLARLPFYRSTQPPALAVDVASVATDPISDEPVEEVAAQVSRWRAIAVTWFFEAFLVLLVLNLWLKLAPAWTISWARPFTTREVVTEVTSFWILPAIVAALVLFGWMRGVRVYDALVEGAKEGFNVALRIIPYLVAILVSVGMFRASGGIDLIVSLVGPWTDRLGMPAEALPMAILRPLSGSGAMGVMSEAMNAHGADSLIGYMVSTFQGSTETTFYVLAVYFGAVGIKQTRHALPACLLADVAGILAAVLIVNLMFG